MIKLCRGQKDVEIDEDPEEDEEKPAVPFEVMIASRQLTDRQKDLVDRYEQSAQIRFLGDCVSRMCDGIAFLNCGLLASLLQIAKAT